MNKPILYIDMDNVLVNFQSGIAALDIETRETYRGNYDEAPNIFSKMKPIKGAVEAVHKLAEHYDIYALSTAPWNNPTAWSDKVLWIQKYFGTVLYKRLILSHHKNLNKGEFLIDDRLKNGVETFEGEHLHFGVDYKNWQEITDYLLDKAVFYKAQTKKEEKSHIELNSLWLEYQEYEKVFIYPNGIQHKEEKAEHSSLNLARYLQDKLHCSLLEISTKRGVLYCVINDKKSENFEKIILKWQKMYSQSFIDFAKNKYSFDCSLIKFSKFKKIYTKPQEVKITAFNKPRPYVWGNLMSRWMRDRIYQAIEKNLEQME
ncbi:5' nucleotidase, NT5C type [Ursidibacter sp. B-7004-1]